MYIIPIISHIYNHSYKPRIQSFRAISLVEYSIRRTMSFFVLNFCSHRKMYLKIMSAKWRLFCLSLSVLIFHEYVKQFLGKYPNRVLNHFSWFNVLLSHAIYISLEFRHIWSSVRWFPWQCSFNILRPRQNDLFRDIFLNENVWISIEISLNCFPKG